MALANPRTNAPQKSRFAVSQEDAGAVKGAKAKKKTRLSFGRVDIPLLTIVILLLLFGLVMLFSASYPTGYIRYGDSLAFIIPQLKYAAVGIVAMVVMTFLDYHILRKFAWPLMILTLVLLVVVFFMAPGRYGAHRWIWLNGSHTQSFQPSELAKFAVILLFGALIAANQSRIKSFQYGFFPFVVLLGVISALLIQQPHLSCTILVLGIGVSMMFAGGTSIKWFVIAVVLIVVALVFTLTQFPDLVSYAGERVATWRDPFGADPEDGYQTIQSLIAVGSGGPTGTGIGGSVQKYLYLPEMYNDYIFAVLCEELGFVGAIALILLFLALLVRGLMVALRAKDKFGSMLVVGISAQIALQAFLHIGVNTNAIPSTGISLPFFSAGGSSLVMLMAQVGVMLSVSRQGRATLALPKPESESAVGQPEEEMAVADSG